MPQLFVLFCWLIVILLVASVAWWTLNQIALPAPIRMIVNVFLGLLAILLILWLATSFLGMPGPMVGHRY